MNPPCSTCDHIHSPADVYALGRFAGVVTSYVTGAGPFRKVHATREDAQAWLCSERVAG